MHLYAIQVGHTMYRLLPHCLRPSCCELNRGLRSEMLARSSCPLFSSAIFLLVPVLS